MKPTIAHVGWTKSPEDIQRLTLCFDYFHSIGKDDFQWLKPVFFDLGKGKDFLTDTGKHTVVVLHYVFRGGNGVSQPIQIKQSPLRVSKHSSWVNWRKRLADTEADYIITFGGIAEVNGTYLADIKGYDKPIMTPYEYRKEMGFNNNPTMSVFIKA